MRCRLNWTPERLDKLKELAGINSGAEIAEILFHGLNARNAVIGMISRLGLNKLKPAAPSSLLTRIFTDIECDDIDSEDTEPELDEQLAEVIPFGDFRCDLIDLTPARCHAPIGDPGDDDFHYCGAPVTTRSYCQTHYQLFFRPANSYDNLAA